MEVLLTTVGILTLFAIIVLLGTRGRPMRFFTAFRDTLATLSGNAPQILALCTAFAVAGGFVYLIYVYPVAGIGPEQPIPFSHRVHAGVKGIDCRFCHPNVARSTHPGLPPVEKCLFCHEYIIKNHPQIRKEHRYFDEQEPIPWRKANFLPEHVLFNHQRHIQNDIQCRACHGRVETMDRIAGREFRMGFCLKCHRAEDANVGCWLACHS
jgi:hypothetical protein